VMAVMNLQGEGSAACDVEKAPGADLIPMGSMHASNRYVNTFY